jgi:hypothetical protein
MAWAKTRDLGFGQARRDNGQVRREEVVDLTPEMLDAVWSMPLSPWGSGFASLSVGEGPRGEVTVAECVS